MKKIMLCLISFLLTACVEEVLTENDAFQIVQNKHSEAIFMSCEGCGVPGSNVYVSYRAYNPETLKCETWKMKIKTETGEILKDKAFGGDSAASCRASALADEKNKLHAEFLQCRDDLERMKDGLTCYEDKASMSVEVVSLRVDKQEIAIRAKYPNAVILECLNDCGFYVGLATKRLIKTPNHFDDVCEIRGISFSKLYPSRLSHDKLVARDDLAACRAEANEKDVESLTERLTKCVSDMDSLIDDPWKCIHE